MLRRALTAVDSEEISRESEHAWKGTNAVAGGGFTKHDDMAAEIRRMYVTPGARSQGVGRRLLTAIEHAVQEAGYARAILDTGPLQPQAEALYRSAGYSDIANYRTSSARGSYWGEKTLGAIDGPGVPTDTRA